MEVELEWESNMHKELIERLKLRALSMPDRLRDKPSRSWLGRIERTA